MNGENKVIFADFDSMISTLKAYKNDPSTKPYLGDWSTNKDELGPFRDNKGRKRIGAYIYWFKEAFDEGLKRKDAIERANTLYADAWGDDKIYYS